MPPNIAGFLRRFHIDGSIDDVFTQGCCYWMARILCERFAELGSRIMYDPIYGHFVAEIDGKLYDITGEVTDKYKVEPWDELDDYLLKERLIRECIMF